MNGTQLFFSRTLLEGPADLVSRLYLVAGVYPDWGYPNHNPYIQSPPKGASNSALRTTAAEIYFSALLFDALRASLAGSSASTSNYSCWCHRPVARSMEQLLCAAPAHNACHLKAPTI